MGSKYLLRHSGNPFSLHRWWHHTSPELLLFSLEKNIVMTFPRGFRLLSGHVGDVWVSYHTQPTLDAHLDCSAILSCLHWSGTGLMVPYLCCSCFCWDLNAQNVEMSTHQGSGLGRRNLLYLL